MDGARKKKLDEFSRSVCKSSIVVVVVVVVVVVSMIDDWIYSAIYFPSKEPYRLERAGRIWYSLFAGTMHGHVQIIQRPTPSAS